MSRESLDRRSFLGRCGGCALAAACAVGVRIEGRPAAPAGPPATAGKRRVRLVFTHRPAGQATWPYASYDYEARKAELAARFRSACPDLELLPPLTLHTADEAVRLIEKDQAESIDGYVVSMVGIWTGAGAVLAGTGKPTLFVDDLYAGSGEFLTAFAAARRAGQNVAGVSSTRFDDVATALHCLHEAADPATFAATCMARLKAGYAPQGDQTLAYADAAPRYDVAAAMKALRETAILVVGRPMQPIEAELTRTFGTRVVPVEFAAVEAAMKGADKDQATTIADGWIHSAAAVIEPSRDEILKAAAMYLGMKDLLARHRAKAITVNCLGGFYGGHLSAYPCLGFSQLNDDGLVGACEADLRSTMTMLAMSELVGRPGFISDPVIDTATHQIIYAHCVAPTRVYGPGTPANPYQLRSHSEDRHGASLRSLLPLGRMTTTLELDPVRKQVLLHQGKSVANVDEDKACRTKLAVDVKGDIDRLLGEWDQWGWHRVTCYGDLAEPVAALAERLGYPILAEA